MSARIEAERPRPLGLGSREPIRLAGRALKTVFTAFKTGTLSDRNKRDIKHRRRQAWPLRLGLHPLNAASTPTILKGGLQPARRRRKVVLDECSVGSDGLQRARHDPLWLAPPHCRIVALLRIPIRKVCVPIAHHLVHAAAVHHAGQAAHMLYEMTKEPGLWRHDLMIDVAVERLVQSEDELRHGARPPPQGFQIDLGPRDLKATSGG